MFGIRDWEVPKIGNRVPKTERLMKTFRAAQEIFIIPGENKKTPGVFSVILSKKNSFHL